MFQTSVVALGRRRVQPRVRQLGSTPRLTGLIEVVKFVRSVPRPLRPVAARSWNSKRWFISRHSVLTFIWREAPSKDDVLDVAVRSKCVAADARRIQLVDPDFAADGPLPNAINPQAESVVAVVILRYDSAEHKVRGTK